MANTYSYPGLAAATGTRVDSSSKHTLACKVSEPLMMCWCDDQKNARNTLHNQKDKYCVFKNDLVLNVTGALNEGATIVNSVKAYPSVVSNLGDMTEFTKSIILRMYHHSKTGKDFFDFKDYLKYQLNDPDRIRQSSNGGGNEDWQRVAREVKDLPFFQAQGYALGVAYASNLSGDTVGTVLIGGMQTVMNGAFEMRAGEMVQWYFDFEADMFNTTHHEDKRSRKTLRAGVRKDLQTTGILKTGITSQNDVQQVQNINPSKMTAQETDRKTFNERGLGDDGAFPKNYKKHNIAYPKPYKLLSDGTEHYGDKIRVFAKCINGGRKFEMVDIMMMTQSL